MTLNNLLQQIYGPQATAVLTWECDPRGPSHNEVWTCVAKIKGIEYGRGEGRSKDAGKELAAKIALVNLQDALARGRLN
ncbi:hypothetical protein SERLA73DRAFT_126018 [Serpula lacrymans var. lacrymans S7.3]|uniref:DRBM domain-containing protein n=2 Tax=Serpula lacrymans var. lacrymans TaxID=341189 RepID=F8QBE6_SERL3|nr:hypothetical protein SERLA73DRAFT_126018 [Serpula lacrymans var. lacrymans S7.3]